MEKKVLLIDDEASLRRYVSVGLTQKGYYTEPCENGMKGLQALQTFKQKKIPLDYAIVDIRLPDIDGLKLVKVIKFNYPGLPVIVITGYGSEAMAQEARMEADGYLEKPFTMEDLTDVLDEIPAPAPETAEEPRQEAARGESLSTYALISLDPKANLLEVYRTLYFQENVLYCDAIRGDYDLVLLLQAGDRNKIEEVVEKQIKTIPGVADVALLSVEKPVVADNVINIMGSVDRALGRDKEEGEMVTEQQARIRASSYVFLEIEKEKLEAVYPALYFNDQVVYCDYTRGKYDVVLLMKGASFTEIEQTIRNKFKTLDGVLRIKEWPIITLFEA